MKVIVRPPSDAMRSALSEHPERDRIDPVRAAAQHDAFTQGLEAAGIELVRLPPDPDLADATFVSDTIVALSPAGRPEAPATVLVATRPGAASRRPEVASVEAVARELLQPDAGVVRIEEPGTLDGGDVIVFGDRIAVGISARTNRSGAEQMGEIASGLGYRPFLCPVRDRLHLASAVTSLGPSRLIGTTAGFASLDAAGSEASPRGEVERILVPDEEIAGANVLGLAGCAFIAAGNPRAAALLQGAGESVIEVELGEFTRADGGPTCLVAIVP